MQDRSLGRFALADLRDSLPEISDTMLLIVDREQSTWRPLERFCIRTARSRAVLERQDE